MRLRVLLTLVVNGIVAAGFVAYGAYTAGEQTRRRALELQSDTRGIARSLAAGAAESLRAGADRLPALLQRSADLPHVSDIAVAGADGRIVGHVRRAPDGAMEVQAPAAAPLEREPQERLGAGEYTWIEPLSRSGKAGWIRITASLADADAARGRVWVQTLVAWAATAGVATLALLLILGRLGARLAEATDFAVRLSERRGGSLGVDSPLFEIRELQGALHKTSQFLDRQMREVRESEVRKSAILTASMDALIVIDHDGRIVDFNPAAERMFGFVRDEVIGAPMGELVFPPEHRAMHEEALQRFLLAGDASAIGSRLEVNARRSSGDILPVELALTSFVSSGNTFFLCAIRDVSSRKTLEALQLAMRKALQKTVADLGARQFALDQHAIVSITDLEGTIVYVNERFCEVSQYGKEELVGRNHRLIKSGLHGDAFYEEMWNTITEGGVWHGELANRRKDGSIDWGASTILPLLDENGQPHQYISVRTDITSQKNTERRLETSQANLRTLVDRYRATEAELSAARTRELAVGRQIQESLLFGEAPAGLEGLSIAVHSEPSQGVDGDFYDFFRQGPRCIDLAIGDVMGKGVPAALLGAAVKQELNRCMAASRSSPAFPASAGEPAARINALHQRVTRRLIGLETFVTLVLARIDLDAMQLTLANAGHTETLVVSGGEVRPISGANLPLGIVEEERYEQAVVPLQEGDLVFLYSDGLTDASDASGEAFGAERLHPALAELHSAGIPPALLVQALRKRVLAFEGGASRADDRSCIAVSVAGPGSRQDTELQLPWDLARLSPLRHALDVAAGAAGLDEEAAAALVLAAFEAATNVIRHNPQPLADAILHCRISPGAAGLTVTMHYLGEPFTPGDIEPDFSGESESGFGLFIIHECVDEAVFDSPVPDVCRIRLEKRATAPLP